MLYEIITQLQQTQGSKAKKQLLTEHATNDELRTYLRLVYEPTLTYYQTELPEGATYGDYGDGPADLVKIGYTLGRLASREVTGFAAKQFVIAQTREMNKATFELFKFALFRDIKAGVAAKSIESAMPGLITLIPYQRCVLPKDSKIKDWGWGQPGFFAYSQIKMDGQYANLNVSTTGNKEGFGAPFPKVEITTRQGNTYPMGDYFKGLVQDAIMLSSKLYPNDTQLQGELLVKLNGQVLPREKSNGVLNSILQSGEAPGAGYEVFMVVWDVIPLSEAKYKNVFKVRYDSRFTALKQAIEGSFLSTIQLVETKIITTYIQATAHLLDALARGEEGTVIKNKDAYWLDGDNPDQVKGKLEFVVDLVIVGFRAGDANGKHKATFGSLLCQTSDGLLEVGVSGMPDALRLELWNKRDYYTGKIVKVLSNDIMYSEKADEPHSLFLPRLVEVRLDKTEADSFARVVAQYEAAKAGANL